VDSVSCEHGATVCHAQPRTWQNFCGISQIAEEFGMAMTRSG
jgi:hypothetical protein